MDIVIRSIAIYIFYLFIFRVAGKRTLAQSTPFDLVLLLIISEAIQNAVTLGDRSVTTAFLVVTTLITLDVGLSLLKQRVPLLEKLLDDVPLVIVRHGRILKDRMIASRVDEEDLLEAARGTQGLQRIEEIESAVLERDGKISVIPKVS
jgi:uncharacterized membrane protein YcaP (DUF421 family)